MPSTSNTLVILVGPSLTGKSNLSALLVEQGFAVVVSTTTRAPREGEVDGKHYHFISKEEFRSRIAKKGFVEHIEVDSGMDIGADGKRVKIEGNFYGVGRDDVIKAFEEGKPVVAVCEPAGAKEVHAYALNEGWRPVRVFLNNKPELLIERFLERFENDSKADRSKYAVRLLKMVGFEREKWIEPALNGTDVYELVFPTFVEENQVEVLRDVLSYVDHPYKTRRAPGR